VIVHLTSSRANVVENIETLREIVGLINESGHVLARDWIEPYYHVAVKNAAKDVDPAQVYKLNVDAIERADVMIIEASFKSFGSGFQVATAMSKKKPTLMLIKDDAKNESIFSQGLNDPLVQRHAYNAHNLKSLVINFLEENNINSKDLRFNFVIDRQLYNYIRWKSFKSRKTKAEIVRELLLKDMDEV